MGCTSRTVMRIAAGTGSFQLPLMLVVVAVQAKQFPVAAIGRVVVVIVVAMMDRQLAQVGAREFACAAAADPRVDLQRQIPVVLLARFRVAACVGDDPVQLARVGRFHSALISRSDSTLAQGTIRVNCCQRTGPPNVLGIVECALSHILRHRMEIGTNGQCTHRRRPDSAAKDKGDALAALLLEQVGVVRSTEPDA